MSAAGDVVGDPEKRKEYDEVRKMGPVGGMFGGPGTAAPGGGFRFEDISDLGDVLGGLFGRRRGGGATRGPGRAPAPTGARTWRPSCTSTSRTRCGASPPRSTSRAGACSTCHGSGAPAGHHAQHLPAVQQAGRARRRPVLQLRPAVPQLRGPGFLIEDPCPTCGAAASSTGPRGQGADPGGRGGRAAHPPAGCGSPGRNGGPPGDLYVTTCA